jgi:hypothetical protein
MPITPFLVGEPFEPEDIRKAFVVACETLRLADRADPLIEIVARKIIEFRQQRGPRDASVAGHPSRA